MAITIDTLGAVHRYGYSLSGFCRHCTRGAFLDLPVLIATGQSERRLLGLRVRCRICGELGELSMIWRHDNSSP